MSQFKVGQDVFCVQQKRRYSVGQTKSIRKVIKVGRQYGYLSDDDRFDLKTGESVHGTDSNARVNGFGFDVYQSEDEYNKMVHESNEHTRLEQRLTTQFRRLVDLPADAVQKIHEVLDNITKIDLDSD